MSSGLIIRIANKKDVNSILEIYGPEVYRGYATFEVELPNIEEMWNRIQSVLETAPWLVAELNGRIVGYCYASIYNGRYGYRYTRQVSVYVHPDFQNFKIGYALYSVLFKVLEKQGYKNLLALIVKENPRSVHLHQKFGFTESGEYKNIGYKFDKWFSIGLYEWKMNTEVPGEILDYKQFL